MSDLDAARVGESAARIRADIDAAARRAGRDPADVELLVAVKYVAVEDLGALVEAGLTLFGENRAQELEAKAAAWPGAGIRWHFIGQLQSRKVKQILPLVELIHSVASDSALAQLERHGTPDTEILVEVNVAGEEGKAGIAPANLPAFLDRAPVKVAGLMGCRRSPKIRSRAARTSRRCASWPRSTGCGTSRWALRRTSRSPSRKGRRSSGWARYSSGSPRGGGNPLLAPKFAPRMGFSDSWHRALVYFGLAEDRDAYEEDEEQPAAIRQPEEELEDRYRERPNVRRLSTRRRRDEIDDIFADDSPSERRTTVLRPVGGRPANGRTASGEVRVHLVIPKSFNDAQDVADKFKDAIPVIINLQGSETDLSKRLIDFASGLTYALDGGMQRIADKVFLLTPRNVELSSEERARLIEKGFFNQS